MKGVEREGKDRENERRREGWRERKREVGDEECERVRENGERTG